MLREGYSGGRGWPILMENLRLTSVGTAQVAHAQAIVTSVELTWHPCRKKNTKGQKLTFFFNAFSIFIGINRPYFDPFWTLYSTSHFPCPKVGTQISKPVNFLCNLLMIMIKHKYSCFIYHYYISKKTRMPGWFVYLLSKSACCTDPWLAFVDGVVSGSKQRYLIFFLATSVAPMALEMGTYLQARCTAWPLNQRFLCVRDMDIMGMPCAQSCVYW